MISFRLGICLLWFFAIKAIADNNIPSINTLPSSYEDRPNIQATLENNRNINASSSGLEKELAELKTMQAQLLTELQQPGFLSSPENQAASKSNIFFPGGSTSTSSLSSQATHPKSDTDAKKTSEKEDTKTNRLVQQQLNFLLHSSENANPVSPSIMQAPASPYIIQAGTFIPAILQTAANSDIPGQLTALVRQSVYDSPTGKLLLIPQGSKLIGIYNADIPYGSDRLQVKFTRLIRPDGSSIELNNPSALNAKGETGLNSDVNNHWGRIIGSGIVTALFTIPAVASNNTNQNCSTIPDGSGNLIYMCSPNMNNLALQSASQTTMQFASNIANKSINIKPTLLLSSGTLFSVLVNKDLIIPPYALH